MVQFAVGQLITLAYSRDVRLHCHAGSKLERPVWFARYITPDRLYDWYDSSLGSGTDSYNLYSKCQVCTAQNVTHTRSLQLSNYHDKITSLRAPTTTSIHTR